jgi:pyridoxamine 5'-phosphate oxidase family protein
LKFYREIMTMTKQVFSDAEGAYLSESRRLGRLATVAADGSPQNNPVGFVLDATAGTIDVFGRDLAATRKFRNVRRNPRVSLVVDDIVSIEPWTVRGVEIRGIAEALEGVPASRPGMSAAVIRTYPLRVISWGLEGTGFRMTARDVVHNGTGPGASPPDVA